MIPIVDLHCDLLSFLTHSPFHSIQDPLSRASYPHMKEGGVCVQVMAIFSPTNEKTHIEGQKQLSMLQWILQEHPSQYRPFLTEKNLTYPIMLLPAFENANTICAENIPLDKGLSHLDHILLHFPNTLYISLTWNGENRFGGGNATQIGLKTDGKYFLDKLHQTKIAIDLSHASDHLADDIINYIDKKSLCIPLIASHSNVRSVTKHPRNLPDFLIKEIIHRKGIIGLNFFAPFIGKTHHTLVKHVEAIFQMSGESHLCFGADFFFTPHPDLLQKEYGVHNLFFSELSTSACYPKALSLLQHSLHLTDHTLAKIAHQNFFQYLTTHVQR